MKSKSTLLVVCLFGLLAVWSGCEDPNPIEIMAEDSLSFEERLEFEVDSINQYIEDQGYDSVFVTASGLRFIPIVEGNGKVAGFGDIITVDLTGQLLDGLIFETTDVDVSNKINFIGPGVTTTVRNLPSNSAVAGVNEGIRLMDEGSRAILLLPSNIAFGPFGSSTFRVAPSRIALFDITLRKIRR